MKNLKLFLFLSVSTILVSSQNAAAGYFCEDMETITAQELRDRISSIKNINKCDIKDVNPTHILSDSPLAVALLKNKDPEVAKILIENGADATVLPTGNVEYSPATIALLMSDYDLYSYVMEKGIKNKEAYNFEKDIALLKSSEDVKDKDKKTEYLLSCADINLPAVDVDYIYGFSRNKAPGLNHYGRTMLQIAVGENDLDKVEFLLGHGADIDIVDEYDNGILYYAESPEMMEILLKHGAQINKENTDAARKKYTIAREITDGVEPYLERFAKNDFGTQDTYNTAKNKVEKATAMIRVLQKNGVNITDDVKALVKERLYNGKLHYYLFEWLFDFDVDLAKIQDFVQEKRAEQDEKAKSGILNQVEKKELDDFEAFLNKKIEQKSVVKE